MSKPTVTILGAEFEADDLLRRRANQLDALTQFCASFLSDLDSSYHDYVLSLVSDLSFEIRQLAEMANDYKGA